MRPATAETNPVVTIVVVAHSVRDELERCFASIGRYAGVPVETILVDNASDDDTLTWVAEAHPEVAVVELAENVGVAARDHGLRRARGRFTMFLDSDAALTAGALPAMVEAMDAHPAGGSSDRTSSGTRASTSSPRGASRRCSSPSCAVRRSVGSSSTGAPSATTS